MQREYKLSLSPSYYSETIHLSQYDANYPLIITVFDKTAQASINGMTAYFEGTRSDGLSFRYSGTAVGSKIQFTIDTALTAVAGKHTGEVVLYDGSGLWFGSANVQILVERAARPDNAIDADVQEARSIAEQIQEIVDTAAEAAVDESVQNWLDEHPEATTTVQDGSLTYKKLVNGTLGFVTPEMYGAVADGETDDTLAIQTAINSGLPVCFSPKTYKVTASTEGDKHIAISIGNGCTIYGNGATIKLAPNSFTKYKIIQILEANNVSISELNIIGDKDEHDGSTGEQGYAISIIGSSNVNVSDCVLSKCWGDGINISATYMPTPEESTMSKNIYLSNIEIHNNRRQGMSVEGCNNLFANGLYIHDISGTAPQSGICIEPSPYESNKIEYVDNVFLSNIKCENTAGTSLFINDKYATQGCKCNVDNCIFESLRLTSGETTVTYGTDISLSNVAFKQASSYIMELSISNSNTTINAEHIIVNRNGSGDFALFSVSNAGRVVINNLSLFGTGSSNRLFKISTWSDDALTNVIVNGLYAPEGCKYTTTVNENKAQQKAVVLLAKDVYTYPTAKYYSPDNIANVYRYDSATEQMYVNMPWIYDGYEMTFINTSEYAVILRKESSAKPSVYFNGIAESTNITLRKGLIKLKFSSALGAWVAQNYLGDVTTT